jgi:hypothetical protein
MLVFGKRNNKKRKLMDKRANFERGSAEYVVLHGQHQIRRKRKPSVPFLGIKNPRYAFEFALEVAYFPNEGGYLAKVNLSAYVCKKCGASNCKLWRPYNSFDVELLCAPCVAISENKSIDSLDKDGYLYGKDTGKTDQIGCFVPAIPKEEFTSDYRIYWGYCTVPGPGVKWWRNLPSLPTKKE